MAAPKSLPGKPKLDLTLDIPSKLTTAVLVSASGADVYRIKAGNTLGNKQNGGPLGNVGPGKRK